SGFLITGLLIRELERDGRVSLGRFYARRAKRLLPAAGLVLVVTAALTWASVSVVQWRAYGGDIVGAALYVVNWVLAARSVDYLAEGVGGSAVQHFCALAVEGQFYCGWAVLFVVVGCWRRGRWIIWRRVWGFRRFSIFGRWRWRSSSTSCGRCCWCWWVGGCVGARGRGCVR